MIDTAFVEQERRFQIYPRWGDYWETINVFTGQTWRSLTRILVLLATIVAITLLTFGVALLLGIAKA